MIRLNAKDDHVEVSITGSSGDIARELHALLDCIKNNKSMQVAMMAAIAVDAISEEQNLQSNQEISEFFKYVLGKDKDNEKLKS